jgi:hypothetical protein
VVGEHGAMADAHDATLACVVAKDDVGLCMFVQLDTRFVQADGCVPSCKRMDACDHCHASQIIIICSTWTASTIFTGRMM